MKEETKKALVEEIKELKEEIEASVEVIQGLESLGRKKDSEMGKMSDMRKILEKGTSVEIEGLIRTIDKKSISIELLMERVEGLKAVITGFKVGVSVLSLGIIVLLFV